MSQRVTWCKWRKERQVENQERDGTTGRPEARQEDAFEGGDDLGRQRERLLSFRQLEKIPQAVNP